MSKEEKQHPQAQHHYSSSKQVEELVSIGIGGDEPDVGYAARMLFHTMLPHSAKEAREWVRKNGRLEVYMQAGPGMNLPYGSYPRLIFVWVVTEAYKQKSRRLVLGDSLSGFMRQLGLLPTGGRWGTITQLREQMQRLFTARIVAYIDGGGGQAMRKMDVADEYDLWWDPKSPDQAALWESKVVLGERFFEQIVKNPFPVDMRILRAIKRSPLGIDLYTWLTYRVFYMKEPTTIAWRQLHTQFGAEYEDVRDFTKKAKRELKKIQVAWPELGYETPRGRLKVYPSEPSVKQIN